MELMTQLVSIFFRLVLRDGYENDITGKRTLWPTGENLIRVAGLLLIRRVRILVVDHVNGCVNGVTQVLCYFV